MAIADKRIVELPTASSIDLTNDWLAVDSDTDGTRKCKPLQIGAKYSLEQDETDSHVLYFTGTDGTDVTITTTDTTYEIEDGNHEFTLVGSNGYEHTVAIPYDSVSMTQAEYDALTPAQKADGTARFITDAISTEESELWSRVGRGTLHTDAQVISNAVNELKGDIDTNTDDISELETSLTNKVTLKEFHSTTVTLYTDTDYTDYHYIFTQTYTSTPRVVLDILTSTTTRNNIPIAVIQALSMTSVIVRVWKQVGVANTSTHTAMATPQLNIAVFGN